MEPPGEGRYELGTSYGMPPDEWAAMEPPGEGRYEERNGGSTGSSVAEPQWSRPVKGGTSLIRPFLFIYLRREPQWSRPVKGGTSGISTMSVERPGW